MKMDGRVKNTKLLFFGEDNPVNQKVVKGIFLNWSSIDIADNGEIPLKISCSKKDSHG